MDKRVLDAYRKRAAQLLKADSFEKDLGIRMITMDEGTCVGELTVCEEHLNFLDIVHGGTMFTLADTISGFAAGSLGRYVTTVNGSMDYMNPGKDCKKLICRSQVEKTGENLVWVGAEVMDEKNNLLSKGRFLYYRMEDVRI